VFQEFEYLFISLPVPAHFQHGSIEPVEDPFFVQEIGVICSWSIVCVCDSMLPDPLAKLGRQTGKLMELHSGWKEAGF
jgi:hypothetical protein